MRIAIILLQLLTRDCDVALRMQSSTYDPWQLQSVLSLIDCIHNQVFIHL